MWRDDTTAFHGFHARLEHPVNSPLPVTTPHPPVLIGGTGEQRTLRLVAEYADACNLFDIPDGGVTIRHKLAVLRDHCASIGRDNTDITKTVSTALGDNEPPAQFAERCQRLKSYGIDHVVVITRGRPFTVADLQRLGPATAICAARHCSNRRLPADPTGASPEGLIAADRLRLRGPFNPTPSITSA